MARGLMDVAEILDGLGIAGVSGIGAAQRNMAAEITIHSDEMQKAVQALRTSRD